MIGNYRFATTRFAGPSGNIAPAFAGSSSLDTALTYPDAEAGLGIPPVFDDPDRMPVDYLPGGYLPGVWSPPGAVIGGLRDGAVFDAIVALFGESGLNFQSISYGGRFNPANHPGRGPFLHVRKLRFANKPDENPTLMARRLDFELTVAWRADRQDRAAIQTDYVAGFAEVHLTGVPIGGFCIAHETIVRGGTVDDSEWPLVKAVMTGQVVYEWDTLYGVGVERVRTPPQLPDSGFDPERLRLRLLDYLRNCATLAPWRPTIRGWEGEPYPWWPPRHDELPYLQVAPPSGRAAWKYNDAYVFTVGYDLTIAAPYPNSSDFTNFFGAVFRALYPPLGDPDQPARDGCFRALDIEGMGSGQMTGQPTHPRPLGHDPYALIGTARCEFLINVVAR